MATEKAMADVPKSVWCGPYEYGVEFSTSHTYCYDCVGCCAYREHKIYLAPVASDTALPQTLMHEVLHALGEAYEINEWRNHSQDKDVNNKPMDKIDMMAKALLQFIRENPKVVEWLAKTGLGAQ